MTNEERAKILAQAIQTYGVPAQTDMCIEEMAELQKALLKYRRDPCDERKKDILEEMADVQIMLDQMKMAYGDPVKFELFKLARLEERLKHVKSCKNCGAYCAGRSLYAGCGATVCERWKPKRET